MKPSNAQELQAARELKAERDKHLEVTGYVITPVIFEKTQQAQADQYVEELEIQARVEAFSKASQEIKSQATRIHEHPNHLAYMKGTTTAYESLMIENAENANPYNTALDINIKDYYLIKELNDFFKEIDNLKKLEKTQKTVASSQLYVDSTTQKPTKLAQHLDKIPEYKQRLGLDSEASDEEMYKAMETLCMRFESINKKIKEGWRQKALQSNQSATGAPLLSSSSPAPKHKKDEYRISPDSKDFYNGLHKAALLDEVNALLESKQKDENSTFAMIGKWTREKLSMKEDPLHTAKMNYLKAVQLFLSNSDWEPQNYIDTLLGVSKEDLGRKNCKNSRKYLEALREEYLTALGEESKQPDDDIIDATSKAFKEFTTEHFKEDRVKKFMDKMDRFTQSYDEQHSQPLGEEATNTSPGNNNTIV